MDTRPVTVTDISGRKNSGEKITALTAYDYSFAKLLDATDLDIILVGDSLGMISLGHENTLAVTMQNMIDHTRAVKQGAKRALVVSDMPFMSYQVSVEQAVTNAGRLIQEGEASSVKLEGGARMADRVQAIVRAGIPVMGHIGLTPQSVHQFGGYKVQGKNYLDSRQIKQDARDLQNAGIFALVLEGIPGELAEEITAELKIPTIGIGAGVKCDGQILVLHDLLGLNQDFVPKFVKQYANLADLMKNAVAEYIDDVRSKAFPGQEHTYLSKQGNLKQVKNGS
ncbi:MAG: 3-methyl-2-oxobutanoate hydroxymethyltransferase [Nitrospinae bacterium]|nr:3-methyl-2-oxobutanoate hydroxymethyltransferase [Nitrospinota bacterium]MZH41418.1 3-methyl-2-oxobutanoate hydroxymethyltransferase [Nitrospinota bacterium]MZH47072.1 3-methyl-2-oxobutanoate hydroxymethyltransferase [Nitrospinota bacterium]